MVVYYICDAKVIDYMKKIGIVRETKVPQDNRVPFSPKQCASLLAKYAGLEIVVQPSAHRCFTDDEYKNAGINLQENLEKCDIIFGVKEQDINDLIANKTYLFFSHTKKKQAYNKALMQAMIAKNIRLIDYECMTHEDGQRVVGFGFFAGVVGAHNGMLTYGKKWDLYNMPAVHSLKNFDEMLHSYFELKLPNVKIAITGGGRVTSGLLEVMNAMDIKNISAKDYLTKTYQYPVYVHLKSGELYEHKVHGNYDREEFHSQPHAYKCVFEKYIGATDILMNGIYWDKSIDRLFELDDTKKTNFNISVIADVTCDIDGSVPCTLYATTIAEPVYGFDKQTQLEVPPYLPNKNIVDMMTVDNLPNELPRDASKFFGEYLEKYIFADLIADDHTSGILQRATICSAGKLTRYFEYMSDYAYA
jgi:saccharopine dehydrogenase (NAD+, L-lysine forming)